MYSKCFSHVPIQQTHVDLHSAPQKLSKIETLRLARNYIIAMTQTLKEGRSMDLSRFITILSRELSQTTANLLAGTLMGTNNLCKRHYSVENNCNSNNEEVRAENNYPYWYNHNTSCRFNENYYQCNRYFEDVRYWETENNKYWPYNGC